MTRAKGVRCSTIFCILQTAQDQHQCRVAVFSGAICVHNAMLSSHELSSITLGVLTAAQKLSGACELKDMRAGVCCHTVSRPS